MSVETGDRPTGTLRTMETGFSARLRRDTRDLWRQNHETRRSDEINVSNGLRLLIGVEYWVCSISMMVASDSTTRRILSTSRSAHPKNLALEGPQIVDLASIRRHLASINR